MATRGSSVYECHMRLDSMCDFKEREGFYRGKKKIIGLPEVQLGIHPGFGGTVRAVQLAGVRPAMQVMLTVQTVQKVRANTNAAAKPSSCRRPLAAASKA